jgi:stage II sporulation protein D
MKRGAFLASTGAGLVALPRVAAATGGLDVGDSQALHTMRVLLASGAPDSPRTLDGWHFAWNGRTFRGTFSIEPLEDGRGGLVNALPLDAYLYGVLSREVSASWPRAAQEAQAIVARTYALGRLRPAHPYDVVAGDADQHYDGIEGETVEGRDAVDATAGTIVTYAGVAAQVAYSACCGGHTADAGATWRVSVPYLAGVVDPHCVGTPDFAWDAVVTPDDLSRAFGAGFAGIGSLNAVELRDVDGSGRPRIVGFSGANGQFDATARDFRAKLGTNVVRSTLLKSAMLQPDGSLALSGNGRGHGVGLCQWGARVMGAQGAAARDIVQFYFPATGFGRG